MKIKLAYGRHGLDLELPDAPQLRVVRPAFAPGLAAPEVALLAALRNPLSTAPLAAHVRPGTRVGIVFSDITRATPHRLILPAVLGELGAAGVAEEQITLFAALGTHRQNTEAELRGMLGDDIVDHYAIVQNDALDPSTQIQLGISSRGHEIWLNRALMACDLRILTGFIEPHFFAGFSGGGKAIMPGMAGQCTVFGNHDAGMISDHRATWGVTEGNPIWEEITEVALRAAPVFLVNVTMNQERQVTGIFAGDLKQAHAAGCAFARQTAMVPVPAPFDIVVTTNSGYPLDMNLYQAVKGMSSAAQIVRPGGAIIVAAECRDGIPGHGLYGQLLRETSGSQALLDTICRSGLVKQDQWQVQIQAQIGLKAEVHVRSDGVTTAEIEAAQLKPCARIEDTLTQLRRRYGPSASICVLPEGPQTIPYLAG